MIGILILYFLALIPVGIYQIISTFIVYNSYTKPSTALKVQLNVYSIISTIILLILFSGILNEGENFVSLIGSCGLIAVWRFLFGIEIWKTIKHKK